MNRTYDNDNKHHGVPLVTEKSREYLNPRQEIDYREFRRSLAEWLDYQGKNPGKADGYSDSVVKTTMNRLDLFFRFIWDQQQRYTTSIRTDEADDWMKAANINSDIHGGKITETSMFKKLTGEDNVRVEGKHQTAT